MPWSIYLKTTLKFQELNQDYLLWILNQIIILNFYKMKVPIIVQKPTRINESLLLLKKSSLQQNNLISLNFKIGISTFLNLIHHYQKMFLYSKSWNHSYMNLIYKLQFLCNFFKNSNIIIIKTKILIITLIMEFQFYMQVMFYYLVHRIYVLSQIDIYILHFYWLVQHMMLDILDVTTASK